MIKQRVGKKKPIISGRAWNISQVFSTSLSEAAEVFAKGKSSFGHTLAKLAKYWNKRILTGTYMSGRSSIIECIAFWIAENEEKNHPQGQDLYRAFREFLVCVSQPKKINIHWCMFYREEDIPPYNRVPPCIVDPTNPYNNLIYENQMVLLKEIGNCAHLTLKRMQKYEDWDRILPFDPLATTSLFWPQLTAEFRQSLSEQESHSKPVLMDMTNTNNSSKSSSELHHPGQKRSSHQDSGPSKRRRLTSLVIPRCLSTLLYIHKNARYHLGR
ncbi:hypothetical protein HOLleu_31128 [Holothuria leucospilota]|uniref:2'-5'-oligoadenylate synthetase 1 domain-containing protein n=1 Tax=Holothuria leucospilota TaxID=206669 RepID=A0A9Q1BLM5_HOLLE|nr:hypothetical protein HOLleu_31128 [Holothuria leucospilota]